MDTPRSCSGAAVTTMLFPSSTIFFMIGLVLPILLLLGWVFPGLGFTHGPLVKLHHHMTDMISFQCSSEAAFPGQNPRSLRMIRIARVNGQENKLAFVDDHDGVTIPDAVLKNMGERSLHVSGSLNEADVSWLRFRLFDFELDQGMRNYGTFTCSVWNYMEDNPWSAVHDFVPGVSLPLVKPGFSIRKDSALDLTCVVTVPTLTGDELGTLSITRTSDGEPMASWAADQVVRCSDAFQATCSPLQNLKEVYYARVRLMRVPHEETHYQCSVEVAGRKYVSTLVMFQPETMCCDSETIRTGWLVVGALCFFILGCVLATVVFLNRQCLTECLGKAKAKICFLN